MRSSFRCRSDSRWGHAVVRGGGSPESDHSGVGNEGVASELSGVLHRGAQPAALPDEPGVHGEGAGRVHLPRRGTGQAEEPVEPPLGIGQYCRSELEIIGQCRHRRSGGEPDDDQGGCAGEVVLHLDQVLLAGQSMAVPDERDDPHPGPAGQIDGPVGAGVGEDDAS
jgi:hypothetical protein